MSGVSVTLFDERRRFIQEHPINFMDNAGTHWEVSVGISGHLKVEQCCTDESEPQPVTLESYYYPPGSWYSAVRSGA